MARKKGRSVSDVSRYTAPSTGPSAFGQDDFDDRPMSGISFFLVTLTVFLAIGAAAVVFGTRSIEATLATNSMRALSAEFPNVTVEVQGTEVMLSGRYVDQDPQRAFDLVRNVQGVTAVEGNIWPISTDELGDAAAKSGAFRASWIDGVLTASGRLSTQERLDFLELTLSQKVAPQGEQPSAETPLVGFDISAVSVDETLVDESAWFAPSLELLLATVASVTEGSFVADAANGLLQVSGEVEDRDVKDELHAKGEATILAIGFEQFTPGILVPDTGPTIEEVVAVQEELNEVILDQVVEFEVKSFELTEAGRALLDEVAATLEKAPDVLVLIEGHTDDRGSDEENQILSEDRARTVLNYLASKGLARERFQTIGYGETRPIESNDTAEGRARNRRIEFTAQFDNVQDAGEGDG